jgi:hypothetical protein
MPEYSGTSLKGLEVETDLFEGMKFSRLTGSLDFLHHANNPYTVVMSDPKSRTGAHDRGELMKM